MYDLGSSLRDGNYWEGTEIPLLYDTARKPVPNLSKALLLVAFFLSTITQIVRLEMVQ